MSYFYKFIFICSNLLSLSKVYRSCIIRKLLIFCIVFITIRNHFFHFAFKFQHFWARCKINDSNSQNNPQKHQHREYNVCCLFLCDFCNRLNFLLCFGLINLKHDGFFLRRLKLRFLLLWWRVFCRSRRFNLRHKNYY